jgi:hypothetical protein
VKVHDIVVASSVAMVMRRAACHGSWNLVDRFLVVLQLLGQTCAHRGVHDCRQATVSMIESEATTTATLFLSVMIKAHAVYYGR